MLAFTRVLLTRPPQCSKTTVVQKVVAGFPGKAAGFYTREVRRHGRRLGFEERTRGSHHIFTKDGAS